MKTLVERLKEAAENSCDEYSLCDRHNGIELEAADYIEKLEKELELLKHKSA